MQLLKVTNDGALHFQLNDGRIGVSYSSGYVRVSTKSPNFYTKNIKLYQINKKTKVGKGFSSYYQRELIPLLEDRLVHLINFNAKNCNAPEIDIKKEFKALFPMEVEVTKAMLSKAVPSDIYKCPGAKALNKGLGKAGRSLLKARVSWGDFSGAQTLKNGESIGVIAVGSNQKPKSMMEITRPTTITLIAR